MMAPDASALGAWLIGAAAVVGALLALWKATAAGWRLARRVGHFLDDWAGEAARPGHPARPSAMERLADLDQRVGGVEGQLGRMCERITQVDGRVARVEHELHPNSGASLRDAVDRIEVRTQQPASPTVHQTFVTPPPSDTTD